MQEENDMDANKNPRYINAILISSYLREKKIVQDVWIYT